MTSQALPSASSAAPRRWFQIDNRYLAPILVTIVLVVGQLSFGFLESWSRTALAILTVDPRRAASWAGCSREPGRTSPAPTCPASAWAC